MNNFNMTNLSWERWKKLASTLTNNRKCGNYGSLLEHISNQAVIAQKDYVCYLALEWAGARK